MRPVLSVVLSLFTSLLAWPLAWPVSAAEFTVERRQIDDLKAVIATVEPGRLLTARARIGGIVEQLKIKEGQAVETGAEIALIADQKLLLQVRGLDQRIRSQQATRDQARADAERYQELLRRGAGTQTQADQARTALDVSERVLSALNADRDVIVQQMTEGAVLAPGKGRVITVPVVEGQVVMPGETVATVAVDGYILRLQLPERHARFMRAGDDVMIGGRGDDAQGAQKGRVRIVYPDIQGGRVIADVEVDGLANYFVGERLRVLVPTGKREAIFIPSQALSIRAGVWFVKLKDGTEIAVQPGEKRDQMIEILSGLRAGDVVVTQ
jgi:membrane fusion protein, multidrug efflux system